MCAPSSRPPLRATTGFAARNSGRDPAGVKGRSYPSELFRAFKQIEIRRFGDYRTARLVLAAWDRMEAEGYYARLGL